MTAGMELSVTPNRVSNTIHYWCLTATNRSVIHSGVDSQMSLFFDGSYL